MRVVLIFITIIFLFSCDTDRDNTLNGRFNVLAEQYKGTNCEWDIIDNSITFYFDKQKKHTIYFEMNQDSMMLYNIYIDKEGTEHKEDYSEKWIIKNRSTDTIVLHNYFYNEDYTLIRIK